MKTMKKTWALVLAVVMALALAVPAYAANGDQLATPENKIEATHVTAGDSVQYFQLVEWKDGNWALTALGTKTGLELSALTDGIDESEATTIANALKSETATGTMDVNATTDTTFEKTPIAAGLYYLKAIPADTNKDTVYNPAFVSADYKEGGNTVDFSTVIGSSTVVKKSTIPFDKEVTGPDKFVDVKPGDTIPYKITTEIPSYGTSFTNPKFVITDTLSSGLTMGETITVKYGEITTTATDSNVTIERTDSGFTVTFAKAYLTGLNGDTPAVEITYNATVDALEENEELENVTYMDNKAKLTFSNTPTSEKDKEDITRHYTFSLDANLNGGNEGGKRTRELIKVGVDANGDTVTAFTAWEDVDHWTEYSPLAGATFSLVGENGTYTATSDANGYISFYGLDAGTYTLSETAAPAGYVKDTNSYTVVITPTYDTTDPDVLKSYEVTVNGQKSTYTITNMNDTAATVESTVDLTGSMTVPFVNTKGADLPSTGGIGTKIFYTMGAVLVVGAGVVLVSRKRAGE